MPVKRKRMPRLKRDTYYGFNHEAVNRHFEGGLTFCNEFCVQDEYLPVAVYKCAKPNKKKGHKKYVLLQKNQEKVFVRGMSSQQMAQFRYQKAVHCLNCDTILYSINRHHYHGCGCEKEVTIDGGKDYTKIGYKEDSVYKIVTLDLLTGKIKNDKK